MVDLGDRVGPYEILARLSAGGMATLFLGRQQGVAGFSRHVAIKVVHPHLAGDHSLAEMLVEEAKLAARIEHPNVVRVEELGEAEGTFYVVMEYVHGVTLAQLLARLAEEGGRLVPALAVYIAVRAAEGLHAAHELVGPTGDALGVVHRDVSPQNILLSRSGHVKLIDFGIAKVPGRLLRATLPGSVRGKIPYMSPEQACGRPLDRRADVYALGIVLWEMLTARRLFSGHDALLLIDAVRNPAVPPPSKHAPEVPPALDEVVLDALAPDRDLRLPTARALRNRLVGAVPGAAAMEAAELATLLRVAVGDLLDAAAEKLPHSYLQSEESGLAMAMNAPDKPLTTPHLISAVLPGGSRSAITQGPLEERTWDNLTPPTTPLRPPRKPGVSTEPGDHISDEWTERTPPTIRRKRKNGSEQPGAGADEGPFDEMTPPTKPRGPRRRGPRASPVEESADRAGAYVAVAADGTMPPRPTRRVHRHESPRTKRHVDITWVLVLIAVGAIAFAVSWIATAP